MLRLERGVSVYISVLQEGAHMPIAHPQFFSAIPGFPEQDRLGRPAASGTGARYTRALLHAP